MLGNEITRDHSLEAQIELIMSNFNFELVHDIFEKFKFTYFKDLTTEIIPSIDLIEEMAYTLLMDVVEKVRENEGNVRISSGRLEAEYSTMTETLSLKFVPEEKEIVHDEGNETIFVC